MTSSRVLITCLILAIGGSSWGCAANDLVEPLCYPIKPTLYDITLEEQRQIKAINPHLLARIGINDKVLKDYISLMIELTVSHNEQFEATCEGE